MDSDNTSSTLPMFNSEYVTLNDGLTISGIPHPDCRALADATPELSKYISAASQFPYSKAGMFMIKPFKGESLNTKVRSGYATIEQKSKVTACELVMNAKFSTNAGSTELMKGQKVLLRADAYAQPWAKQVLEFEGVEFIVVPEDAILGWL